MPGRPEEPEPLSPLPDRGELLRAWVVPRFQVAMEATPCGMILTDTDGSILLVNREIEELFGHPRSSLVGNPILMLVPPRLRDRHRAARGIVVREHHEELVLRGRDAYALRADQTEFPVVVGLNPIDSPFGTLILSSVTDSRDRVEAEAKIRQLHVEMQERVRIRTARLRRVNDLLREEITRRKAIEEQLRTAQATLERANRELQAQAALDPLTGIHNRRFFDQSLDHEWRRANRTGRPLSLLLFDIDNFKQYNDGLGHPAGDDCLQQIAQTLRSCVRRPADVVARLGGEEFAVLLPETGRDGALAVAETMRKTVRQLELPHPNGGVVTVSVGVCCRGQMFDGDAARLLELADEALYRAKAAGRDCVRAAPKSAARRAAANDRQPTQVPATERPAENGSGAAAGTGSDIV